MALQSIQHRFGYEFPAAYTRVQTFSGDKTSVIFVARTYAQASAAKDGSEHLFETQYQCSYEHDDLIPELYSFLKEQPAFQEAIDV